MTAKWAPSFAAASSCLPSLRCAEVRADGEPGRPQVRRDPESLGGRGRVGADDHGDRRRLGGRDRRPPRAERQQDAIEPDSEPDARRRPPAEQLDEPVVAPAAAERRLLAAARPPGKNSKAVRV